MPAAEKEWKKRFEAIRDSLLNRARGGDDNPVSLKKAEEVDPYYYERSPRWQKVP